jgi:hypothetical protein
MHREHKAIDIDIRDRDLIVSGMSISDIKIKKGEVFPARIVIESKVKGKTYWQRYYIDRRERGVIDEKIHF